MKHTTNNSAKTMITIIIVPHRNKGEGISPKRLRTFSERNLFFYILIHPLSLFILKSHFHYLYVHNRAFLLSSCHSQKYKQFSQLRTGCNCDFDLFA